MSFYVLSFDNKIIDTSDDWNRGAAMPGGQGARSENVLGACIWSVVAGRDTQTYLNALFFTCRRTQAAVTVPYRCDTPTEARLFEMEIEPLSDDGLKVSHRQMPNADIGVPTLSGHDGTFPQEQCSQCLRLAHGDGWVESFPFLRAGTKGLHYTVCPSCKAEALESATRLQLAEGIHR
ncbi:MAG: hypothetical protein MUD11_01635 [Rhodobacteraceae bacterium]|jgi:hypothetical protein|nr:hypothetical protein [Paracoccaceae bacterium]